MQSQRYNLPLQADAFYREGEGCRLTKREAVRESYRRSGEPPTDEVRAMLLRLAREGGGREAGEPIKLLDVGSCGTLFDERYEGLRATALDLCPQAPTRLLHRDVERLRLEFASCCPARLETEPARTRTVERGGCAWLPAL